MRNIFNMKNKKKQAIRQKRIDSIMQIVRHHAQIWDTEREILAHKIIDAFYDTQLGNGIGFYEANAHDDYSPDWQMWRSKDERIYWEKILAMVNQNCPYPQQFHPMSAFTFMDNLGRHFALPCYLLWELQGRDYFTCYHLASAYSTNDLPLNKTQQIVLFEFVQFMSHLYQQNADDVNLAEWDKVHAHLSKQFMYFQAA